MLHTTVGFPSAGEGFDCERLGFVNFEVKSCSLLSALRQILIIALDLTLQFLELE